jgi:antitoxin HicB
VSEEKGRIGGRFADFLDEQGLRDEVEGRAIRALLAEQLRAAMAERKMTKAEMARRMNTPRAQLDRLLDPEGPSITLATLQRAAAAVGRKLHLELS